MELQDMLYIFIGIIILYFLAGLFVVRQQNIAIIERFGKFLRMVQPGLHVRLLFIDQISGYVNLRIQQLDVLVETKTEDNVFVKIKVSVQYRVLQDKCYDAFYRLENPETQIESYVFDVVRAKVPNMELDHLFSRKDEIATNVKQELQDTMIDLGYEIIKALVTDIEPNQNVKDAMNEINTSLRLRVAAQERAEADKIMRIKQAEAEAESNILHGKGIAGQRLAIMESLSQSVDELQKNAPHLDSDKIMNMILLIQYFDMLREIGATAKSNTVFVNHSPNQVNDLTKQLQETFFAPKPDHKAD